MTDFHAPANQTVETTINLRKWAVVGASAKPDRYSYKIVKLLQERGYDVYPVAPRLAEIDGLRVYASIADLPEKPDVVDMVVNPATGIDVMKQIAAAGIRYVWLQPGAESPEIHAFARENGIVAIDACILAVLAIRRNHRV